MAEIVAALPNLSALIERGGIIGILLIVCGVMANEVFRLRKELTKTYKQRDRDRLRVVVYKSECDRAGLKPDLSALADMAGDEA